MSPANHFSQISGGVEKISIIKLETFLYDSFEILKSMLWDFPEQFLKLTLFLNSTIYSLELEEHFYSE